MKSAFTGRIVLTQILEKFNLITIINCSYAILIDTEYSNTAEINENVMFYWLPLTDLISFCIKEQTKLIKYKLTTVFSK